MTVINDTVVEALRVAILRAARDELPGRGCTLDLWAALRLVTKAIEANPGAANYQDEMRAYEARIPDILAAIDAEDAAQEAP